MGDPAERRTGLRRQGLARGPPAAGTGRRTPTGSRSAPSSSGLAHPSLCPSTPQASLPLGSAGPTDLSPMACPLSESSSLLVSLLFLGCLLSLPFFLGFSHISIHPADPAGPHFLSSDSSSSSIPGFCSLSLVHTLSGLHSGSAQALCSVAPSPPTHTHYPQAPALNPLRFCLCQMISFHQSG